jgi:hypothetical protein
MTFNAYEFPIASEALQHVGASAAGVAITLRRQPLAVSQTDADRLEASGVELAYLCGHEMPDGSWRTHSGIRRFTAVAASVVSE